MCDCEHCQYQRMESQTVEALLNLAYLGSLKKLYDAGQQVVKTSAHCIESHACLGFIEALQETEKILRV